MRNSHDNKQKRIDEALSILSDLGLPRAQQNERSALCLLALLGLSPDKTWAEAAAPLMGITPIMDWAHQYYDKEYAPNTRETFRRQTMHQFVDAAVAVYNPDEPDRPTNSPHAVYQIEPTLIEVLKAFGSDRYSRLLADFQSTRETLAAKYAREREMAMVPLKLAEGKEIALSPGLHSELIKEIWEQFGPRFAPGGQLVYAGDTGEKWGYFDEALLSSLGVKVNDHGKMPDVIIFYSERKWLILAEAVTSHGPVDAKRYGELQELFGASTAGLVFVSAFPDRRTFTRYAEAISWETEVWVADNPTHLIHYNGARFLGPYSKDTQK